jgi:hypothetical protein
MKMLAGTLRRGSGMIGFGGVDVVADVLGAIATGGRTAWGSEADIWKLPLLRACGAGRGNGIDWA